MLMTPFQRKKQEHYFKRLDADHNGFIERADFEEIGQRLATAFGFAPENPVYAQIGAGVLRFWEALAPADTNKDGRISLDEFLQLQQQAIYDATPEQFDAHIGQSTRFIAALIGGTH